MKFAWAFVAALALPACAAVSSSPRSYADDGGSGSSDGGKSFGRAGGYVSGAAVKGVERFDDGDKGLSFDDGNIGYAVRGGMRTADGFALEASVERVDSYTIQAASARQDLDFSTLSVSGKFFVFDGRFQPYLTAGIGWAWVNISGPGTGDNAAFYRGGLGVDVYLTESIALFAEGNYDWMTGDLRNLDHVNLMAGVMFRF